MNNYWEIKITSPSGNSVIRMIPRNVLDIEPDLNDAMMRNVLEVLRKVQDVDAE